MKKTPAQVRRAAKLKPGTRVRFTAGDKEGGGLGASEREDLTRCTVDRYFSGEEGVLAFEHPNQKVCRGWWFVEVDSKIGPSRKLYVGVGPKMFEVVKEEAE